MTENLMKYDLKKFDYIKQEKIKYFLKYLKIKEINRILYL